MPYLLQKCIYPHAYSRAMLRENLSSEQFFSLGDTS